MMRIPKKCRLSGFLVPFGKSGHLAHTASFTSSQLNESLNRSSTSVRKPECPLVCPWSIWAGSSLWAVQYLVWDCAVELNKLLRTKWKKKKISELLFHLQACWDSSWTPSASRPSSRWRRCGLPATSLCSIWPWPTSVWTLTASRLLMRATSGTVSHTAYSFPLQQALFIIKGRTVLRFLLQPPP